MSEIINKYDKFLVQWKTEKITNIVKSAVEQMPKEATNIRLIEGYRHSVGAFGTHNCWTEVEAVYNDDNNNVVKRVRTIDKHGGWQYSDPANYVLYNMGLYKPYNDNDLKSIKARYESDLNRGNIFPINQIYSNQYLMDLKVKEAIYSTVACSLTFKLHSKHSKFKGSQYNKYTVKLGNFETEPLSEHDAYFLFTNTFDMLIENGIKVFTFFDMSKEDKQKLNHWVWRDEINF